jgi:phospholipid-binding lipoprotein MlaA
MRPFRRQPAGPRKSRAAAVAILAVGLGLAAAPACAQDEVDDPLEPLNRTIFSLNELLDLMFIEPVSIVYGEAVPEVGRQGVRNFLNNLASPMVFLNDLLQGERERAGTTLGRFMINTFFGLGLFDLATEFGYPRHSEDFGQTLAVWGVGMGPYLVLPVLGPSSVRDGAGRAVDFFVLDPVGQVTDTAEAIARATADGVDTRQRLTPQINDLRANSLDRYATVRSVYVQLRAAEIRNGAPPADDRSYEGIFDEEDELAPTPVE